MADFIRCDAETEQEWQAKREKAERIAFVKRVAEALFITDVPFEQCIFAATDFYNKLKEWESKQ